MVPFGMEEGTEADVPEQEFGLVVGAPAEFRFLGSTVRRSDTPGTLVEEWEGADRRTGAGDDDPRGAGQGRPDGARAPAQQSYGGRHAGIMVPQPRRQAAMEVGVQCARPVGMTA